MSATQWKCGNCGTSNESEVQSCIACHYAPIPPEVRLGCSGSPGVVNMRITTAVGRRILRGVVSEHDLKFVSEEQFTIVKDTDASCWVIKPGSSAVNPTQLNGILVPPDGFPIAAADVITVGSDKCQIRISFP